MRRPNKPVSSDSQELRSSVAALAAAGCGQRLSSKATATPHALSENEVEFSAIRAQGPGGQNVNKVSSAVQLRFDVLASSLPPPVKAKLLSLHDSRVSKQGVIVIKAQVARSLAQNKAEAMARLLELVAIASSTPVPRRPTKPTFGSKQRRLKAKTIRAGIKADRSKVLP